MKIPAHSTREAERALQRAGFRRVRQKGGHKVYTDGVHTTIVPHDHRQMRRSNVRLMLKQAGLTDAEYIELLKE